SGIWREDTSGSNPWGGRTTITNPPGGLDGPWNGFPGGNPYPYVVDKNAKFTPYGQFLTTRYDLKTPNVYSWNLSLQKQIAGEFLASASYIGARTTHIWTLNPINPAIYIPGNCQAGQFGLTAAGACSATSNTDQRRLLSLERPQDGQYIGAMAQFTDAAS